MKIAQQYSTDVASLVELNNIANPDLIFAGQSLNIPGTAQPQSEPTQLEPVEPQPEQNQPTSNDKSDANTQTDDNIVWVDHIIAPGEWLSTIAWKYNLSLERLAQANQISNPNLIFAGQVLSVPTERPAVQPTAPVAEQPPAPTAEHPTIEQRLEHWSTHYDIPQELFKALTWWESGWNNSLISTAGAVGIGQLMPATVDFVSNVLVGIPLDPHNPDDNIRMSARFLRYLLDETGNDRQYALGAYYQGLYSVRTNGIYLSSMQYINGILSLQARFR